MSPQHDIFNCAIDYFSSEQEDIRAAASFAAGESHHFRRSMLNCQGNIAIGNLPQFLPAIVKIVEQDPKKRLLSLHSLKEVNSGQHSWYLLTFSAGRNSLLSWTTRRSCRHTLGAVVREL